MLNYLTAREGLIDAYTGLEASQFELLSASASMLAAIGRLNAKDLNLPVRYYDPGTYMENVKSGDLFNLGN